MASFARLGDTALGLLRDRLELISIELQEEKFRLIRLLIWLGLAILAGVLAMVFLTTTVVYLFWEEARIQVLAGFTIFYAALLALAIVRLRRTFTDPKPFSATLDTLKEDCACIRKRS